MACDYIVNYECVPKREYGRGDIIAGTEALLEMVKARNRAEAIEYYAEQLGKAPEQESVTLNLVTPEGVSEQRQVTYGELSEEAAPLEVIAPRCADCPANFLERTMGCSGAINYPVSSEIERWVVEQIEPADHVGGNLCLQFMKEFQVDGSQSKGMRSAGFFEDKRPRRAVLSKGLFRKVSVSTDQIFDAILAVGNPLQVGHCMGVLLWFGALTIDGVRLGGVDQPGAFETLCTCETRDQKLEHVTLDVGTKNEDSPVCQMQDLLEGMYRCWVEDVPLLISV
jgi:hypothetical protein